MECKLAAGKAAGRLFSGVAQPAVELRRGLVGQPCQQTGEPDQPRVQGREDLGLAGEQLLLLVRQIRPVLDFFGFSGQLGVRRDDAELLLLLEVELRRDDVLCRLVSEQLRATYYEASAAGLDFSLVTTTRGLELSGFGFSQRLADVANEVHTQLIELLRCNRAVLWIQIRSDPHSFGSVI